MIRVQAEDFDLGAELAALREGRHDIGALASFVGLVREMAPEGTQASSPGSSHNGFGEQSMTLEHYPGMTEKMLAEIEAEARARWPLQASLIIHRYGRLLPGEQIVLVACASPHRHAAFEACQFLMDWLKTKAPFWKLEEVDGKGNWVDARESDEAAARRWQTG
jgi:molybdopterin synthase catalytic subunit